MTCKPTTIAQKYAEGYLRPGGPTFNGEVDFVNFLAREKNPVERFERERLFMATLGLSNALSNTNLNNWPYLESRVSQSIIPYPEIGDFLLQTGYELETLEGVVTIFNSYVNNIDLDDPSEFEIDVNELPSDYTEILDQLELYYSENIANTISGGFCGAFANAFNQIQQAISAIRLGVDLIQRLADFSLDDLFNALNTLRDKLLSIVDRLVENLTNQLQNIINRISALSQEFLRSIQSIVNSIRTFYENFSIEAIREQIERFINESVAQFEELTPEAIALLMFRFCQFAELIQSFLQSPIGFLNNITNRFTNQQQLLASLGNDQTRNAVRAGGPRLSTPYIERRRQDMYSSARPADPTTRERPAIYSSRLTEYERNAINNMGPDGFPGYFTFSIGQSANVPYPGAHYLGVQNEVWEKFVPLCREMGREMVITSAYRHPSLRIGVRGSLHNTGRALDVSIRGLSDSEVRRFIATASGLGFGGIGGYSTFIHVDVGSRRIWGPNSRRNSVSQFRFANELIIHERNGYQRIDNVPLEQSIGPS
jgi:hypothetical protein